MMKIVYHKIRSVSMMLPTFLFHPFAVHQIPLFPTGGIGVESYESQQFPAILNQNFLYIVKGFFLNTFSSAY